MRWNLIVFWSAIIMAFWGVLGTDDVKTGVLFFGIGLYMLNFVWISDIQKRINDFEGGKE